MSCRGHVLDVNVTHNWFQQSHLRGTLPQLFNTLRPRQKGRHFADDIVKCIFLNENVWISINISLRFVPRGPIDNIPALVQIMAWRRPGDKPLSEPMMVSLMTHIYMRHSASMSYGMQTQRYNMNGTWPFFATKHVSVKWPQPITFTSTVVQGTVNDILKTPLFRAKSTAYWRDKPTPAPTKLFANGRLQTPHMYWYMWVFHMLEMIALLRAIMLQLASYIRNHRLEKSCSLRQQWNVLIAFSQPQTHNFLLLHIRTETKKNNTNTESNPKRLWGNWSYNKEAYNVTQMMRWNCQQIQMPAQQVLPYSSFDKARFPFRF